LAINLATDLGIKNFELSSLVNLVQEFGTTRTLSSPRINAMNNQPAILTFAENQVYALLDIKSETLTNAVTGATTQGPLTITSEIRSVPIGVILNLQPSIDLNRNEVVLSIRPTLTRIISYFTDPASDYAIAQLKAQPNSSEVDIAASTIPVVEVRELDTVMRINDGQAVVIGGLMREEVQNVDRGTPGLSKLPFVGNLFKNVSKTSSVIETVIFLKATINRGKEVEVLDKQLYKDFFPLDRRPII
jgi:general secretion pathway protein D